MSKGETTNLGPQLETGGPRFSIVDMGSMVGPARMDTRGMLKSEMRSVYENHSLVQTFNRALADPSDAIINLLKPLIILVALVVGFIGAALILESKASATTQTPAAADEATAPAPTPEPVLAATAAIPDVEPDFALEESIEEEEAIEEAADAVEPAPEPAPEPRDVRKARKVKRGKKHKRSKKRRKHRKRRRR